LPINYQKDPPESSGSNKVKLTVESSELLEEKSFFAFKNFTNWAEVDFYRGDKGCPFDGLRGNKDAYTNSIKFVPTQSDSGHWVLGVTM